MTQNGGSFDAREAGRRHRAEPARDLRGSATGRGGIADVKLMHKVGIYKLDGGPSN